MRLWDSVRLSEEVEATATVSVAQAYPGQNSDMVPCEVCARSLDYISGGEARASVLQQNLRCSPLHCSREAVGV